MQPPNSVLPRVLRCATVQATSPTTLCRLTCSTPVKSHLPQVCSGVVYGVNGEINYDPKSRVNTFAHVNHTNEQTRLGILLCINGTGILNSWVKRTVAEGISYPAMNDLAAQAP